MIKVLVVISGLVMLVPEPGPNPQTLTAIVLASEPYLGGVPEHVPALRQLLDPYSARTWNFPAKDFKASFEIESDSPKSVTLGNWDDFVPLLDLEVGAGEDFHVKKTCLTGDCRRVDQKKLVAGIVQLTGGWTTRAATRCNEQLVVPPEFTDQAELIFRTEQDPTPNGTFGEKRLATAMVLDGQVDAIEDLAFLVGNARQTIQLSDSDLCHDWFDSSVSKCVIFELENWPRDDHSAQCDCSAPEENLDCQLDRHFRAFYDLLVQPPASQDDQLLPYVKQGYCDCGAGSGAGNPPAIRCPPPTGVAEP